LRPSARLTPTVLLAGAALATLACQHGINLQGKVNVPQNVHQMFSAQHPGELVVRAQIPGQPDIVVPSVILCGSTAAAQVQQVQQVQQVIEIRHLHQACANDDNALVSAWVIPRAAQEVSCTSPPPMPRPADTQQSANGVAFGRTVAPVNAASAAAVSCRDGSISFALTLEPRR
jgi:hypothetical protein